MEPPRRGKEKKEDGVVRSLPKNTTQFRKQSPVRCRSRLLRRVVGEGVGLVKRKNDERSLRSPCIAIQQMVRIYEFGEEFSRIIYPLQVFGNVRGKFGRYVGSNLLNAFHELQKTVILAKNEESHRNLPRWPLGLPLCRNPHGSRSGACMTVLQS